MSSNPSVIPMGLTFSPTEQQVIKCLWRKIQGMDSELDPYIEEVDNILELEPCELAAKSKLGSNKDEWWFFSRSFYRNSSSQSKHRKTKTGFWQQTGRGKKIEGSLGKKSYLTFHKGSSKSHQKTDYTMQEYYIPPAHDHLHQEYILVICCLRLKKKGRKADAPRHHEEGELSGNNITSDFATPLVQCDHDVSYQQFSQIYLPDSDEQALRSLHGNAIQAPSGVDGKIRGKISSDFTHVLGNEMQAPFEENGEISGKTTSDPENPLGPAVITSPVIQWDDDESSQLVSLIYPPDSTKQNLSSLFDNKIQAPSGTDGELSGQSSSDFDNQAAFVARCDYQVNPQLSWPIYSPDVSNENYVKFAEENDNRTKTGQGFLGDNEPTVI
ncbi:NAC domain-containing protein 96-like isoform X2 [Humulus lupulus]|uniref:NAC domain-containing protein 96-like isoform X2 n=1 Tax=Humulus lupulus TaxID=3486 RepID=UPI002B40A5D4|nr:NAC domain-containing protein 96-like isoform X2 [Humulus lupulus]